MKRNLLRILVVNLVFVTLAVIAAHTGPLLLFFVLAVLTGYVLPVYTVVAVIFAFRRYRLARRIEQLEAMSE